MDTVTLRQAADRIRQMEVCFDALLSTDPASIRQDDPLLECLTRYYESGQWLRDYELDEQGFLPRELKRGVLAQDAVYDLLERISDRTE